MLSPCMEDRTMEDVGSRWVREAYRGITSEDQEGRKPCFEQNRPRKGRSTCQALEHSTRVERCNGGTRHQSWAPGWSDRLTGSMTNSHFRQIGSCTISLFTNSSCQQDSERATWGATWGFGPRRGEAKWGDRSEKTDWALVDLPVQKGIQHT